MVNLNGMCDIGDIDTMLICIPYKLQKTLRLSYINKQIDIVDDTYNRIWHPILTTH